MCSTNENDYKYFYRCLTCNISGTFAFCHECLDSCHLNHDTQLAGYGRGSCDCNKFIQCQSKTNKKSIINNNESNISLLIDKSIQNNNCTYGVTKDNFYRQNFYRCLTCGLKGNLGCCESCAKTCHSGHLLLNCGELSCYCDCSKDIGGNACKLKN